MSSLNKGHLNNETIEINDGMSEDSNEQIEFMSSGYKSKNPLEIVVLSWIKTFEEEIG